jgi:two-component system heavy metal sensor histidine kinase CusS
MTSRRSLGAQLSLWLALQSMAGLGLICGTLYFAVDWTLQQRQTNTLVQKARAVQDQLLEQAAEERGEGLNHLLGAVVAGHAGLGVQVTDQSGRPLFAREIPTSSRHRLKEHSLEMRIPQAASPVLITLQLDASADFELLQRIAWLLVAAALLGSAGISAGGYLLVRRGLKPLHQLVGQTRQLAAHTLEQRLDGSAQPAELQPLIDQFNALLDRLAAAYLQMESFNADVAHELNTPLTTLISSSELALRKARDMHELQDVLGSNLEELARLARIVADMLFLSRAYRGAAARREHIPSLAALATDVAEFHEAALQEAGLSFSTVGDASGEFDAPLLQRALSNLLSNATRYATAGSTILLRISCCANRHVQLVVENLGVTIPPEHVPRLFDRFFRADAARSQADRNHGLGLAIVDAIGRMHGGGKIASSQAGLTRVGLWVHQSGEMTETSSLRLPS